MIDYSSREKTIKKISITGIALNLALSLLKAGLGLYSSSVSILNDAVNNATDSLSSIVTLVFYSLSRRHPTKKHPLGYGRIEYISAMLVSVLIIVTGIQCAFSSVKAITANQETSFSIAGYLLIAISIGAKIFLSRVNIHEGKRINSETLIATGKDALSDVLVSLATLIAAIFSNKSELPVDGIAGLIVSIFILYSGISAIVTSTSSIMGERADEETVRTIRSIIKKHPPLKGGYDILVHNYGPERALGTCNVEVAVDKKADDIFDAMTEATKEIQNETGIYFTFGLYAVNDNREDVIRLKHDTLLFLKKINPHVVSLHAFHIHFDRSMIHFDIVIDFTVKNINEFKKAVYYSLRDEFPQYDFEFEVDLECC